jgi:hypothetical protein
MPNPDVAVPSLPEPSYTFSQPVQYTAVQMCAYARTAILADRAAGRASAEPEGFVLVPREPTEAMQYAAERAFVEWGRQCDFERDGEVPFTKDKFTHSDSYRAMLAAAPTPTASIAPKAEGEAELARGEVPSFESWWESWPFKAYKNELTKAAAHHAYRAGKAIGEGLTDCPNCLGDGKDGDVDDYGRMVGFDCHQCNGTGKVLRAAPVAQAAAGAVRRGGSAPGYEEKRPVIPRSKCALYGGSCNCDPDTVFCPVHNGLALIAPHHSADADRASGGGV